MRFQNYHTHTHTHTRTRAHTRTYRYTRKQPIHFSVTPLRPKFKKKFFQESADHKIGTPKKMTPKSQANIKATIPTIPILTIF